MDAPISVVINRMWLQQALSTQPSLEPALRAVQASPPIPTQSSQYLPHLPTHYLPQLQFQQSLSVTLEHPALHH
jgi:hypothetical protein